MPLITPKDQTIQRLVDLRNWTVNNPPEGGWRGGKNAVVYLKPDTRFNLQIDTANQIGYGLFRDDELADHGVSGAEADCNNFSISLLDAIEDKLSIMDLTRLKDEVEKRLAQAQEDLSVRAAKHSNGSEEKFTPAMRKEAEKAWNEVGANDLSPKQAFMQGHMTSLLSVLDVLDVRGREEE